jgi:hypothetical protein
VKDSAGQKLAYVYFEDEPGRRSAAKLLTKDEARPLRSVFEGGQDWKSRSTAAAARIDELTKFICYYIEQHAPP